MIWNKERDMSSIKYIQAGHPGAHLRRGRSRRINHHGAAPLPALDRCAPCCWGCSAPCPAMSDAPRRAATTTITSRPAGQLQSPGARHPTDVDPLLTTRPPRAQRRGGGGEKSGCLGHQFGTMTGKGKIDLTPCAAEQICDLSRIIYPVFKNKFS